MSRIRRLISWVTCTPVAAVTFRPQFDGRGQIPVPVTGMTTGINNRTGERPVRWEINTLQAEGGPRWYSEHQDKFEGDSFLIHARDLYIQGLAALQNKTETDEGSHFSLAGKTNDCLDYIGTSMFTAIYAGIHGMPYAPYNGVGPVPGGSDGGFCPHGETQFVAWHRLYVILYEQLLGSEVQRVASEYSGHQNSSAYEKAAKVFRVPYWDWAANAQLPPSCTMENITVKGPRGPLTLRNPLYSYRWPTYPLNQSQFPGSENWPSETTRASDGRGDFSPDAVNSNLADVEDELKDLVYRTFTSAESYDQMSSMLDQTGVSLEAPHNIIHNAVGGSYASLDITAFDALFMLHHANIDRLAALWTAIHLNATYQSESYATIGLYGTARGDNITAASPLKPFFRANGRSFHTGLTAPSLAPFGYTYPELAEWDRRDVLDPEQRRKAVITHINKLYGSGNGPNDTRTNSFAPFLNPPGEEEWFVHLAINRSILSLPCTINVHLRDNNHLAGRVALLGMPKQGPAYAEIALQRAIRRLGPGIATGSHSAVEQALRSQLRVDVVTEAGSNANIEDITGLELHLAAVTVVSRSSEYEFPKYGNMSVYAKVFLDRVHDENA
ncbi:Di-copper centre-containing protein [Hypoxylon crocopeplum]|nr:Di-copper centre-containing protein [Hypoxylon crocopeplum]